MSIKKAVKKVVTKAKKEKKEEVPVAEPTKAELAAIAQARGNAH